MTVQGSEAAAPDGAYGLPEPAAALGYFPAAALGRLTSFTHEWQLCGGFLF